MAILVECTSCRRKFRAKQQYRGRRVKCPGCQEYIVIEGEHVADHDVFLSYSQRDKTVADALCAALEGNRMRCWIAPRDIGAGQKWGSAIVNAIEDAQAMVLIYSAHSNRSEQVLGEVERAVAKGVPIVPFRIDESPMSKDMEYFLSASHWIDALTEPLAEHIERLVPMIRGLLAGVQEPAEARPARPAVAAAARPRRIGRRAALGAAAKALAAGLSNEIGDRDQAYNSIADAQARTGDFAGALATCKPASLSAGYTYSRIARAQAEAGRIEDAKRTAERIDSPIPKAQALRAVAAAEAKTGDVHKTLVWIEAQGSLSTVFACCGVVETLAGNRKGTPRGK